MKRKSRQPEIRENLPDREKCPAGFLCPAMQEKLPAAHLHSRVLSRKPMYSTLRFYKILKWKNLIPHFFPSGQKFIEDLCIGCRGAVEKNQCSGMNPVQQFFKSFFFGRLLILIPVYIGETPEKAFIAKFFCHL